MEIMIQSLHFTARPELNAFVNEKVGKLSHFQERIEAAEVCLKLDKSEVKENKVCEILLRVPGNDLFAKKQCKSFEEAANKAVDALQQQLKKQKAKF